MITLVKIKSSFYKLCKQHGVDKELLYNEAGRPCVLLVRLRYKDNLQDFVIPMRSNISKNTPNNQYFSLPPNSNTKAGRKHGVHYIKLFPVKTSYIDAYRIFGDAYYTNILLILNKHEREIVQSCQDYLDTYGQGNGHVMTPDIDGIINMLSKQDH